MWPIGRLDRGFASLPFDRYAVSVLFIDFYFLSTSPRQSE
jgi:hypothetical protein